MSVEHITPERLTKPEQKRSFLEALRLLFSDQDAYLVSHQLEETRWTLPVLAAFHLFATLSIYRLAFDYIYTSHLLIWTLAGFAAEVVLIVGYFALDHISESAGRARSVLRFGPFAALSLCLVWGWAALVFGRAAEAPVNSYIDLLALLTLSVGMLCTVRMPATALQFILTPVVILVTRATLTEDAVNWYGLAIAAMAVAAGVSVMLAVNYSFQRRVLAEKMLKHDSEVLMLLLADFGGGAKDWLWETDADGHITYHSPKFAELLGRASGEDCLGLDFISGVIAQNGPLMMSKILVHEDLRDEPMTTRDADGQMKHWQLSAKPRFEGARFIGYRGIALDVTSIQQQTQAVVRAEGNVKKSYEAKSQFLSLMARELRNPVNAIVGFSEVLAAGQNENLPPVVRRDYMATILNSGRQLQGLLHDVLEASQLEDGSFALKEESDDFSALVDAAIKESVPRAAFTKVSVVARLYEDVDVKGDLTRLKALAGALLAQAISAAPAASAVQVEMARAENGDLTLAVRDKGAVLSKDEAARAFEPFTAFDARRSGGLGLGLAIARRVARLHGGDVSFGPAPEQGMEARLTLPAARVGWHPVDGQLRVMNIAA